MDKRELAARTAALIRKHPDQHEQGSWLGENAGEYWRTIWLDREVRAKLTTPPEQWGCGTTACAAGWVLHVLLGEDPDRELHYLDDSAVDAVDFLREAQEALELTEDEASSLFIWTASTKGVLKVLDAIAGGHPLVLVPATEVG